MEPTHHPMEPKGEELGTVTFWFTNQIALTFHSRLTPSQGKQAVIDNLPLDKFNELLKTQGVVLQSFGPADVIQNNAGQINTHRSGSLQDPRAKYLFPSPSRDGSILVGFFHLVSDTDEAADHTPQIVNFINEKKQFEGVQVSAMPNWLSAGTGDVGHGCPLAPPVPVDQGDRCANDPGNWPIAASELPDDLLQADGDGVTVLVLDTVPQKATIDTALSQLPAGTNKLLEDLSTGFVEINMPFTSQSLTMNLATPPAITSCYQVLPAVFEQPGEHQPMTGKDIDGNLIGYPMADHGLFVAGIIRSLTPRANIVCVRVLNDMGAGNAAALIAVLESISNYVQEEILKHENDADFHLRLIINMSMVVTPYDEQLDCLKLDASLSPYIREGLELAIQSLTQAGVIIVAAAGNDSDARSIMTCMEDMPDTMRLGPRYPAALAASLQQVISVGAIDGTEQAAPYSNYPGTNGIATYGGGLLKRDESTSPSGHTEPKKPIDSLRGVYTASFYPALSKNDTDDSGRMLAPGELPAGDKYPKINLPNYNAWAYWSGTSFSTPIITGLAARVLQAKAPGVNVRQEIINLAGTKTVSWTNMNPVESGPVIYAWQCLPANPD